MNNEIATGLIGVDGLNQIEVDALLREIDGSPNLKQMGANAILATSLATCKAGAIHCRQALHKYIGQMMGSPKPLLPMPMTNILSGGAHAGRGMDFQDFLVVPVGAATYSQALSWIVEVRGAAATLLAEQGLSVLLADEGGLSPGYRCAEAAFELLVSAIKQAGLRPGLDMAIAIDVAASELRDGDRYRLDREQRFLSGVEMSQYLLGLLKQYPIISIEDPFDQDDWASWRSFMASGHDIQVVGDDLFATNTTRIEEGVRRGVANAVLIKLNQNGTLSGTLEAMSNARNAGYSTVISARSGETEDTFIADLAVGTGAGQIKIGSVRNSDRLAKYNQLLRIEEDLEIEFAGVTKISGTVGSGTNR